MNLKGGQTKIVNRLLIGLSLLWKIIILYVGKNRSFFNAEVVNYLPHERKK